MKSNKLVVLLAEDDADFRQLLSRRLTLEGMWVVEVDSGFALRDWLELPRPGARPSVVVTDFQLPGLSGLEALLTADLRGTPVVLITAFGSPALRVNAARAGITVILEKPFAPEQLVSIISRLCGAATPAGTP